MNAIQNNFRLFRLMKNSKAQIPRRLKRPLKKSEMQIPRGLRPARNDKANGPIGTSKLVPFPIWVQSRFFQRSVLSALIRGLALWIVFSPAVAEAKKLNVVT